MRKSTRRIGQVYASPISEARGAACACRRPGEPATGVRMRRTGRRGIIARIRHGLIPHLASLIEQDTPSLPSPLEGEGWGAWTPRISAPRPRARPRLAALAAALALGQATAPGDAALGAGAGAGERRGGRAGGGEPRLPGRA